MKNHYKLSLQIMTFSMLGLGIAKAQFFNLGEQVSPSSVNNNSVVAASIGNTTNLMWTEEGGLKVIGVVDRDFLAGHTLVGDDGGKIIGYMTNPDNNLNEISIYNVATDTWQHLGGIVGNSDASKSSPWGMSRDGSTIVGLGWINGGTGHAIKWTQAGGMVDIGSTVQGRSSRANAINDDKSVIVGWQDDTSGFRQGAYWVNGVQSVIKNQAGVALGEAGAVSGDGNIITGTSGINPYVFNKSTSETTLVTHPSQSNFFRGGATGVSGDGKKVIGFYRPWPGGPYFGEGFIWTPEKGRIDLNEYIASLGIDVGTLKLSLPIAISPDGYKITGVGLDTATNKIYGFLIDIENYLATNDTTTKSKLNIYPNPVKNVLNINGAKTITKIEIYNMLGQKIKESNQNNIDVSELSNGTYVVTIDADGTRVSQKIIKE